MVNGIPDDWRPIRCSAARLKIDVSAVEEHAGVSDPLHIGFLAASISIPMLGDTLSPISLPN